LLYCRLLSHIKIEHLLELFPRILVLLLMLALDAELVVEVALLAERAHNAGAGAVQWIDADGGAHVGETGADVELGVGLPAVLRGEALPRVLETVELFLEARFAFRASTLARTERIGFRLRNRLGVSGSHVRCRTANSSVRSRSSFFMSCFSPRWDRIHQRAAGALHLT